MSGLPPFEGEFPSNGEITTQIGDVLDLTFAAEQKGIMDTPASSLTDIALFDRNTDADLGQLNAARFNVAARQLWLLGYFRDKPRKNISRTTQAQPRFRKIVRKFQKEAGLTVDGWIGVQTWHTLQELVSFETAIDRRQWVTGSGLPLIAFQRALTLRMWAYGLIDRKPKPTFQPVPEDTLTGIREFLADLVQKEGVGWDDILMGDEVILEALLNQLGSRPSDEKIPVLRRLAVNAAKIELWLLGLDVEINGKDDYPVTNLGVNTKRVKRGSRYINVPQKSKAVERVLVSYWSDILGYDALEAKSRSKELSRDFFDSLANPDQYSRDQRELIDDEDYSQQVSEYFENRSNTSSAIDSAFAKVKAIGMKIWDGIKRLWRWIKRGVKKVVSYAQNMARGFFRFATKGFHILKTSLKALWTTMKQYTRGWIETNDASFVAVRKDGDFQLLIGEEASFEKVSETKLKISRFTHAFYFSCRLVGCIVDLLKASISGVTGWARFLLTLVKNYRSMVPLYRDLQRYL